MNVDLTTTVGSVTLPNPILTASGTSGHGAELAPYVDEMFEVSRERALSAAARFLTPSFFADRASSTRTVESLRPSSYAITFVVWPIAAAASTWSSRFISC